MFLGYAGFRFTATKLQTPKTSCYIIFHPVREPDMRILRTHSPHTKFSRIKNMGQHFLSIKERENVHVVHSITSLQEVVVQRLIAFQANLLYFDETNLGSNIAE